MMFLSCLAKPQIFISMMFYSSSLAACRAMLERKYLHLWSMNISAGKVSIPVHYAQSCCSWVIIMLIVLLAMSMAGPIYKYSLQLEHPFVTKYLLLIFYLCSFDYSYLLLLISMTIYEYYIHESILGVLLMVHLLFTSFHSVTSYQNKFLDYRLLKCHQNIINTK